MSYNYIILSRRTCLIKIGYSRWSPEKRLKRIQAMSPDTLELFDYWRGTHETETEIHQALWRHRAHGEWFRIEHELVQYMESFLMPSQLEILNGLIHSDPPIVTPKRGRGRPGTGSVYYSSPRKSWVAQLDWTENGKRRCRRRHAESESDGREMVKGWIADLKNRDLPRFAEPIAEPDGSQ